MPPRKPPPALSLGMPPRSHISTTILQYDSPVLDRPDSPLQLSSPEDSPLSSTSSPLALSLNLNAEPDSDSVTSSSEATSDDMSKDLAVLEKLRKSVQKNLRLRPIKSSSSLPKIIPTPAILPALPLSPPSSSWSDFASPVSSTGSVYYTPLSPLFSASYMRSGEPRPSRPLEAEVLYDLLMGPHGPLMIDTRPPAAYAAARIRGSINLAIPSLILKRYRKQGSGGFQSLDGLRQFVTTDRGKQLWDELTGRANGPGTGRWNGSMVIYDEEMSEKDREGGQAPAWALIPLISPLLQYGSVDYLRNGLSSARNHTLLRNLIITEETDSSDDLKDDYPASGHRSGGPGGKGLFQLDTITASRSRTLPQIEHPVTSPLPMMPGAMSSSSSLDLISDTTPSPPPSQLSFRKPPPPRKPSVPNLRRLDTKSAERLNSSLPKLQIRTPPMRAATLAVPSTLLIPNHNDNSSSLQPPRSPSHLNLMYSTHSPPGSATRHRPPPLPSPGFTGQSEFNVLPPPSPSFFSSRSRSPSYPTTPRTPMPLSSPATARPENEAPLTTEDTFPTFTISAILPNFLYLGPELTIPEHVDELKALGVKRILNIAAECDDDHGLQLRKVFDRYYHIPMRDTVEEDNITRGVREACDLIDDARLHSAATYVHCKAGKSRSVTAVIAYLIHANHWTLSRAYSFVLERRKGISPNIGFVSELMTFEEQELGGKSVGVVQPNSSGNDGDDDHHDGGHGGYGGRRQGHHARESLPPAFSTSESYGGPMSAGGISSARVGDSGQEMEIKDATGRYRHARRAPVNEQTLQPMRRVSKAGLESSMIQ